MKLAEAEKIDLRNLPGTHYILYLMIIYLAMKTDFWKKIVQKLLQNIKYLT